MDNLRNLDIMAAAHRLMDVSEPYMLLSGYRSPETNAMLRSKSKGVAKNSLHMKGQAADLRLKLRSVGRWPRQPLPVRLAASVGIRARTSSTWIAVPCAAGAADPASRS